MLKLYTEDVVDEAGGEEVALYDESDQADVVVESTQIFDVEIIQIIVIEFIKTVVVSSEVIAVKYVPGDEDKDPVFIYTILLTLNDIYHKIRRRINRNTGEIISEKVIEIIRKERKKIVFKTVKA